METIDYVSKILSARKIEAEIEAYNKPIYERIGKEVDALIVKYNAEVAAMKERLTLESKSWPSRIRAAKLKDYIQREEGCINAKYVSKRHSLYRGKNGPLSFYSENTDMTPHDVVFGDITLTQAIEAAKQLYDETPEWLKDMVEAEKYASCYEVNKVSREQYIENEYKRHGGKWLGDGMNIVMMNVNDMSYELPWIREQ